jgi:NADH-quinone oxidoreductase subunit M
MILILLIIIPTGAGILGWLLGRLHPGFARWISLIALAVNLILALALLTRYAPQLSISPGGPWLAEINLRWIPELGINFHLAVDGLSLVLVLLTAFLGMTAVGCAWKEIKERVGFFYFNLMWVLAGITGVFLSLNLFQFYFFWEMMLVPMFFIIAVWGDENRAYAALKFFLFTQISGLLMLFAIIGLYFVHGQNTGVYTFDYRQLLETSMSGTTAIWLMLGFLAAFLVKLPAVPVHTWLPDAYAAAPTAGSVVLAGLMAKTGAYGLLRFVVPLFSRAAFDFAPVAMLLAILGILYGALLAFSQTDLKRLVAYTSVSHMGFVLLGVFVWNQLALQGVVLQILSHGLSTGALFILAGAVQQRTNTRDMRQMGGLWAAMPRMGGVAMFFALAAMGLPGLGNFLAEFLVLFGAFRSNVTAAVLATLVLISATVYALWMMQAVFHGPPKKVRKVPDLSGREAVVTGAMILAILWLGLYPQPVFTTTSPALQHLEQTVGRRLTAALPPQKTLVLPETVRRPSAQSARRLEEGNP